MRVLKQGTDLRGQLSREGPVDLAAPIRGPPPRGRESLRESCGHSCAFDLPVGGWGIGSSSENTWRLSGLVEYRASELISIQIGWTCVKFDHESGSGAGKETVDIRLTGPRASITFHF